MANVLARTLLQAGICAGSGRVSPLLTTEYPAFESEEVRESLLARALAERMVPMVEAWSRRIGVDLGSTPARLTSVFGQISAVHYLMLEELLEDIGNSGVKVALLKGGDLDLAIYPPDVPRSMADIDLLVRPMDIDAVEAALTMAGFQQGSFNREELKIDPADEAQKAEAKASGLELISFGKIVHIPELSEYRHEIARYLSASPHHGVVVLDRDVYSIIGFDVHINLSSGFDLADSWWNLRTLTLPGGGTILAQPYSDLLWFLAARLYHEIVLHDRPAMRYFADVCAVLAKRGEQIDWSRVVYMGQKYKLHPSLYFVLWHANEILGSIVPEWVLEAFDLRNPGADRSHDWGDFALKMLGELAVQPLL